MQNEISFEEWHNAFKAQAAAQGLPVLDESLAEITHMEGLSVDEAIEQYKRELG
jgi:hypothetical protein